MVKRTLRKPRETAPPAATISTDYSFCPGRLRPHPFSITRNGDSRHGEPDSWGIEYKRL